MYVLPPFLSQAAVAGPVVVGVATLPATGMPGVGLTGVLGGVLVVAGIAFVVPTVRPVYARLILRCAASCAILGYVVRVISMGAVTDGWDAVGLLVGVFTLAYASLAFRHLLPAARQDAVSPASPHAGLYATARLHRAGHS